MRRHSRSKGKALRARLAIGAMGAGLLLAFAAPAAYADTCANTDLTCIAGKGGDTAGGVVGNGKGTLGGEVDKGKDVAGGILHTGKGTVGRVVGTGRDTIDRVLHGRSGGSGGTGGTGSGGSGSGGDSGSHGLGPGGGRGGTISGRTFTTSHATDANTNAAQDAVAHHRRTSLLRSIGGTVVDSAKQLGFPMILGIVVALFVAFQNRLDRHDPKLSKAPLTPDRMRFV
jgi:hypothetical protein